MYSTSRTKNVIIRTKMLPAFCEFPSLPLCRYACMGIRRKLYGFIPYLWKSKKEWNSSSLWILNKKEACLKADGKNIK